MLIVQFRSSYSQLADTVYQQMEWIHNKIINGNFATFGDLYNHDNFGRNYISPDAIFFRKSFDEIKTVPMPDYISDFEYFNTNELSNYDSIYVYYDIYSCHPTKKISPQCVLFFIVQRNTKVLLINIDTLKISHTDIFIENERIKAELERRIKDSIRNDLVSVLVGFKNHIKSIKPVESIKEPDCNRMLNSDVWEEYDAAINKNTKNQQDNRNSNNILNQKFKESNACEIKIIVRKGQNDSIFYVPQQYIIRNIECLGKIDSVEIESCGLLFENNCRINYKNGFFDHIPTNININTLKFERLTLILYCDD